MHLFVTTGHAVAATVMGLIVGLILGVIWSPRVKAEEQKLASTVRKDI